MKFTHIGIAALVALPLAMLAGCQEGPSFEEAERLCTAQGGLLAVIYTQQITTAGKLGRADKLPGQCISPSKFGPPPAPAGAPAPAK